MGFSLHAEGGVEGVYHFPLLPETNISSGRNMKLDPIKDQKEREQKPYFVNRDNMALDIIISAWKKHATDNNIPVATIGTAIDLQSRRAARHPAVLLKFLD